MAATAGCLQGTMQRLRLAGAGKKATKQLPFLRSFPYLGRRTSLDKGNCVYLHVGGNWNKKMAIVKKIEGDEFYLYMNGKLIYKRWLKTGESKVFDVMAYDKYTILSITQEDIEIPKEIVDYLLHSYTHLMTVEERAAMKNFMLDAKLQVYQPESEEYRARINAMKINTPKVKRLIAEGGENFKLNWVKRILQTEAEKIVLNRCKVCGGLARTPRAKQCRYCGHQWHKEE